MWVEWHIFWQENRKQDISYQDISCRKRAFFQEISWFYQNWPKISDVHEVGMLQGNY